MRFYHLLSAAIVSLAFSVSAHAATPTDYAIVKTVVANNSVIRAVFDSSVNPGQTCNSNSQIEIERTNAGFDTMASILITAHALGYEVRFYVDGCVGGSSNNHHSAISIYSRPAN